MFQVLDPTWVFSVSIGGPIYQHDQEGDLAIWS
jgi:hypothetical protein